MRFIFTLITALLLTGPVMADEYDSDSACFIMNQVDFELYDSSKLLPEAKNLYFSDTCISTKSEHIRYRKLLLKIETFQPVITIKI